jgi:hypothetical protein
MRTEEKENYIRENLTHHLPTLTALKNLKKNITLFKCCGCHIIESYLFNRTKSWYLIQHSKASGYIFWLDSRMSNDISYPTDSSTHANELVMDVVFLKHSVSHSMC